MPVGRRRERGRALDALREALRASAPYNKNLIGRRISRISDEILGRRIKEDARIRETSLTIITSPHQRGDARRPRGIVCSANLTKPIYRGQPRDCLAMTHHTSIQDFEAMQLAAWDDAPYMDYDDNEVDLPALAFQTRLFHRTASVSSTPFPTRPSTRM